jgi:hypothetical protein
VTVANAEHVDHTYTRIFRIADAVVVKVSIRARIFAVHNAVVVAVMQAIVVGFFVVADVVLVHIQAVVFVVADAVRVRIRTAVTTAVTDGIKLRAVAVTIPSWDV